MKSLTNAQCLPMSSGQWLSHNAQQYDADSAREFDFNFAGSRYLVARWMTIAGGDTKIEVAENEEDRNTWFPTEPDATADFPKTYWLIARDKIEPLL